MLPFDQVTLTTQRLVLRPLSPADAEPLFGIFSDPKVMRYWSTPAWISVNRAHEMIAKDQSAMTAGEHLRLGIELQPTAEFIGTCTLFDLVAN